MVIVDRDRCCYCGGCVSVCPVDALTLAETRLRVTSECTECGECVSACPVGALQLEECESTGRQSPVRRRYDLVVVGAGPGGSIAAKTAAEAGLSVLLLEKRQEIGSPVRCAEGVGRDQLMVFIEPDPRWIAAEVNKAEITTIAGGEKETLRATNGHGYILERRVFDRVLAEQAAKAGADVRVKTAATGLLMSNRRVVGIRIRQAGFFIGSGEVEVEAQVVIAADGVEAQVGRWAGLDVQLPLEDTMVCAQYLLAGIEIDPECTCYTICYEVAPGGYAWIFPKGEGKANVGLGMQADLWEERGAHITAHKGLGHENHARKGLCYGNMMGYLTRFIEAEPGLEQGYPVTLVAGNVPVALSPERLVAEGFMLVGDAARQVDPITGGGIINAMTAGKLAATVAVEAIANGDTSTTSLERYEEEWNRTVGRKMQRNYRLRERFPPEQRANKRFVHAFALAAGG